MNGRIPLAPDAKRGSVPPAVGVLPAGLGANPAVSCVVAGCSGRSLIFAAAPARAARRRATSRSRADDRNTAPSSAGRGA